MRDGKYMDGMKENFTNAEFKSELEKVLKYTSYISMKDISKKKYEKSRKKINKLIKDIDNYKFNIEDYMGD